VAQESDEIFLGDGMGHTTVFLSACVDAAVSQYFLTGMPPAAETVCNQDFGPFDSADNDLGTRNLRSKALSEVRMPARR